MTRAFVVLTLSAAVATSGCGDINTALFVTSTSIGIDVDSKPPTASIAYDRVEFFGGPDFGNGGAPTTVGSSATAGTVFNPHIQQTYATGAAAALATGSNKEGPRELTGNKKLMMFGTGTTIGLKVGFGPTGAPDSVSFGYKRKEASIIPLGTDGDKAVYPSVFASIDTTTTMASLPEVGLATKQFFATGEAAENLAKNPEVTALFKAKSTSSVVNSLTEKEKQAAVAYGVKLAADTDTKIDAVIAAISCNGKIVGSLRDRLVAAAPAPKHLTTMETPDEFRQAVRNAPTDVDNLYRAASKQGSPTCPKQ